MRKTLRKDGYEHVLEVSIKPLNRDFILRRGTFIVRGRAPALVIRGKRKPSLEYVRSEAHAMLDALLDGHLRAAR